MTGTATGHRLGETEAWDRLMPVRDPAAATAAGLQPTTPNPTTATETTNGTGTGSGTSGGTGSGTGSGAGAAAGVGAGRTTSAGTGTSASAGASTGGWRWREPASAEAGQLADLYAPLCLAGPELVIGQLGQSLDGAIATRTGDAVFVTGDADRLRLHRMRALVDAVVVGVDTVRADDPRLTVRACAGHNPVRVVLDHRGRADSDRGLFADGAAPTLWLLGPTADPKVPAGVEVLRLPCTAAGFAPADVVSALADRGLGRVLVEGGGVTVSRFLAAGALHRLYLAIAPVLIGDGVPGVTFPGTDRMADALRAPARRFTLGEDTLFELTFRPTPNVGHPTPNIGFPT